MHIKLFIASILFLACTSSIKQIENDRENLQSSLNECRKIKSQSLKISELYESKKNDLKLCIRRLRSCNQRLQNSGY